MLVVTDEILRAAGAVAASPSGDLPTVEVAAALVAEARKVHALRLLIQDDGSLAAGCGACMSRACRSDALIRVGEALSSALLGTA